MPCNEGLSYFSRGSVPRGLYVGVCPEATATAQTEIRQIKKLFFIMLMFTLELQAPFYRQPAPSQSADGAGFPRDAQLIALALYLPTPRATGLVE
jgi:hypothetical protein